MSARSGPRRSRVGSRLLHLVGRKMTGPAEFRSQGARGRRTARHLVVLDRRQGGRATAASASAAAQAEAEASPDRAEEGYGLDGS